jgi:UDP-N-acetylglucosamine:LPS N-acetylglucosamine transferase
MVRTATGTLCLVASSGGHLTQLMKLHPLWLGRPVFFVTTVDIGQSKLRDDGSVYVVGESNRHHPLQVLRVMFHCLRILLRERPKIILSTGAAAGFIMCFFGKLLGAKIIWLDSIANAGRLSMSGRMIRPFADLILSQWPDVAARYPKVKYAGELI